MAGFGIIGGRSWSFATAVVVSAGRDSLSGVMTRYMLDGPGVESRLGEVEKII